MNANTFPKVLIVGDAETGKTSLFYMFIGKVFPTEDMHTLLVPRNLCVDLDGEESPMTLFDTKSDVGYDELRPRLYPDTEALVLCFSVVDRKSFDRLTTYWIPEFARHAKLLHNASVCLTGLKADLRNDPETLERLAAQGQTPVTQEEIDELLERTGWASYVECSALTRSNVHAVFQAAKRAIINGTGKVGLPKKDKSCDIM